ncbi:LytR/AlgR family response regulator transcription factor [Dyadobacter pollutisoli]|jgi:DNA-binding LytR/AlgR family response regulator|uniref:LytTR family DNA-binding domain-containing protein n=1 Tax=Dyadobacter pollutisoli TaxID=2910158 RepID=A0A9E8NDV4_9BACT|nr:LytTR family DNA-binding domain-containing protein [Dyadobacter pollutisoli]WAC14885.1 LytTR family DNA-binding domain-containing protein [Dyadobacter pollutisoli]
MTKIQCLVVDDERLALEVMEANIERVPFLHLAQLCATPMQALDFLSRNSVDVLFLDIEMPGLNGLQFLQTLKNPPLVILTTAYPQFAVDAFELNVVDYLLKPIPFNRFLAAVQKVQAQWSETRLRKDGPNEAKPLDGHIFIKSGSKTVRIDLQEILFIEGKKEYIMIHTRQSQITTQASLSSLMEKLPANQFVRIHRSFIIALAKIESIERNRVLIDKTEIPIGEFYREDLLKRIS